jgi:hypothetical protein
MTITYKSSDVPYVITFEPPLPRGVYAMDVVAEDDHVTIEFNAVTSTPKVFLEALCKTRFLGLESPTKGNLKCDMLGVLEKSRVEVSPQGVVRAWVRYE